MEYGIIHLPIAPLRLERDDRSEMISQALFGELLEIVEKHDKWWLVRLEFDKYSGWIDPKQLTIISQETYETLRWSKDFRYCNKTLGEAWVNNQKQIFIPFGACLPPDEILNNISDIKITANENDFSPIRSANGADIVSVAEGFIGSPYLWGGKSCLGFDCSGFVQLIYKTFGIRLERDASVQSNYGETINFISEARAGDLAFFDNEEGNIIHVGILADTENIIHASGEVRRDRIDHHGIYNEKQKRYTHNLRLIKRNTF